jgi:hypothetical protein
MANDERLIQLIQGLHRGTLEGKIHWERTAAKGVYLANFPEYAVRISVEPIFLDQPSSARNYYVRIYNVNGDMLEEITDRQFTKTPQFNPREVMMETYNEARHQAMGADQAIEALLKVLQ